MNYLLVIVFIVVFIFISSDLKAKKTKAGSDKTNLPVSEAGLKKAEETLAKMTIEEKILQLAGLKAIPRLKMPRVIYKDAGTGIRGGYTAFPAGTAMASTWNPDLIGKVGESIAEEAIARNIKILLGPNINVYRVPGHGRAFEVLSEDPYLISAIVEKYIKGVQGKNVIACVKHFAGVNDNHDRHRMDSIISERALHEIYFPGFKAAVQNGHSGTLMTAYSSLNGAHCSENKYLLNKILKDDWGFRGFVMSDWGGTYNFLPEFKAGLDVEMPAGKTMNIENVTSAIKKGIITEKEINSKILRKLATLYTFDAYTETKKTINWDAHDKVARKVAEEGIVLLKNNNNLLPFNSSEIKSIAVLGPNALITPTSGGGASYVVGKYTRSKKRINIMDAIKNIASEKKVNVKYYRCFETETIQGEMNILTKWNGWALPGTKSSPISPDYIRKVNTAPKWSVNVRKISDINDAGTTLPDKLDLTHWRNISRITPDNLKDKKCIITLETNIVPPKSGEYYFKFDMLGKVDNSQFTLYIDGKNVDLKKATYRKANDFYGKYTMQAGREYHLKVEIQGLDKVWKISFLMDKSITTQEKEATIQKAAKADAVVICAGFNARCEQEGHDRIPMLFSDQEEVIRKIAALNKNVVVVVNAGGGFEPGSWMDKVSAIVHSWYLGQNPGEPVADMLFGLTNPSGKLPITIEKSWEDCWAKDSYNLEWADPYCRKEYTNEYVGKHLPTIPVKYKEGIFIGYRAMDTKGVEPAFPFGHGLSYTTFKYSNPKISSPTISQGDTISISCSITNTGNREGAEVVQLYIADMKASLPRPKKELKGFAKIFLAPGETKDITMNINTKDLSFYNESIHQWIAEPGEFQALIGASSRDIKFKLPFELKGKK